MASRCRPLPVHSGSAPTQCLGSRGTRTHKQKHTLCVILTKHPFTDGFSPHRGQNKMKESIYKRNGGGLGRNEKKKAEDREEVRRSVSDKILSPAYKRFNSLSPLITLSLTLQCLHVCLWIRDTGYMLDIYTVFVRRDGEKGEQVSLSCRSPADLWSFYFINDSTSLFACTCECAYVCEKERESLLVMKDSADRLRLGGGPAEVEHFSLQKEHSGLLQHHTLQCNSFHGLIYDHIQ